jgi:transposase
MIDWTVVRAHQHAAGTQKRKAQGESLGRSRGGFSTKIHLRTNGLGLPVAVVLTGGETSDIKGYGPVMAEPGPQPKVLMADKGYDADAILADLEAREIAAVFPPKRNRKVQPVIDGHLYAPKNLVECCFSKLKAQSSKLKAQSSKLKAQSSNTAADCRHDTTRPPTATSASSSSHPHASSSKPPGRSHNRTV